MAIIENEVSIWISINSELKQYYEKFGYKIPFIFNRDKQMVTPFSSKLLVKVIHLHDNCSVKVTKVCDICGSKTFTPYNAIIISRKRGDGLDRCQRCGYVKMSLGKHDRVKYENSLEYIFRQRGLHKTLSEFDIQRNIISTSKISAGDNSLYWWLCFVCKSSFEASPNKRKSGEGCPYCAGKKVNHTNNLYTTRPDLIADWNFEKNTITPDKITYASNKKVWWKCSKCGFEYMSSLANKSSGRECVQCLRGFLESKGERRIREFLENRFISFTQEYWFDDCRKKNPLPFDFAIFDLNGRLIFLIEYDGEQHFKPTAFGGVSEELAIKRLKATRNRDNIKNNYCTKNRIPLLRIPYIEYDNIEKIIENFYSDVLTNRCVGDCIIV